MEDYEILLDGLIFCSLAMLLTWIWQWQIGNLAVIDIVWSFEFLARSCLHSFGFFIGLRSPISSVIANNFMGLTDLVSI